MKSDNSDYILFDPQQIAEQSMEVVKERRASRDSGVTTGFAPLDADLIPLLKGDLMTIIARPSNYKTGFMLYMAGNEARKIVNLKKENEVVVYITWEIAAEEAGIMDLCSRSGVPMELVARGTIDDLLEVRLKTASIERAKTPIWVIGHSMLHRKKRPGLSLTDVGMALKKIEEEHGKSIRLVCLDYLQAIAGEGRTDLERDQIVASTVNRCKDMGLALGCPVVLGCQAKREVDLRDYKLPGMSDGMGTSSIEHVSDKVLGLWMPYVSHNNEVSGRPEYEVKDKSLVIGLAKQRYGKAQRRYFAEVDFQTKNILSVD